MVKRDTDPALSFENGVTKKRWIVAQEIMLCSNIIVVALGFLAGWKIFQLNSRFAPNEHGCPRAEDLRPCTRQSRLVTQT